MSFLTDSRSHAGADDGHHADDALSDNAGADTEVEVVDAADAAESAAASDASSSPGSAGAGSSSTGSTSRHASSLPATAPNSNSSSRKCPSFFASYLLRCVGIGWIYASYLFRCLGIGWIYPKDTRKKLVKRQGSMEEKDVDQYLKKLGFSNDCYSKSHLRRIFGTEKEGWPREMFLEPPEETTKQSAWYEGNLDKRLDSWKSLLQISAFFGAFAFGNIFRITDLADWNIGHGAYAAFVVSQVLALAFLETATVLLILVIIRIQRELAQDKYIYTRKDEDGRYQFGMSTHRLLKLLTTERRLFLRINALNAGGRMFLLGFVCFMVAALLSVLDSTTTNKSADADTTGIPGLAAVCIAIISFTIFVNVVWTIQIGIGGGLE